MRCSPAGSNCTLDRRLPRGLGALAKAAASSKRCVRNVVLQVLGCLYPQAPHRKLDGALQHFKSAAEHSASDPGLWEMLGDLTASTNPAGRS